MKSLSRPMFRRGGGVSARNNGIVSGFDNQPRQPFAPENENRVADDIFTNYLDKYEQRKYEPITLTRPEQSAADIIKEMYPTPQKPSGFSQSDYLRLLALSGDILANPSGGTGLRGALQTIGAPLSRFGTDLAQSFGEREQRYDDQLREIRKAEATAALSDKDTLDALVQKEQELNIQGQKEIEQFNFDRMNEMQDKAFDALVDLKIAEEDKLEIERRLEFQMEAQLVIADAMSNPEKYKTDPEAIAKLENAKMKIEVANAENAKLRNEMIEKAQNDPDVFNQYFNEAQKIILNLQSENPDPLNKKYAGMSETAIMQDLAVESAKRAAQLLPGLSALQGLEELGLAKGGRVGFNVGGMSGDEEVAASQAESERMQMKDQLTQKQNALMNLIDQQRSLGVKNSNRVIEEIEKGGSVLSPSDKEFIMERNNAYNSYNAMMREKAGQMGRGDMPGYYNEGGLTRADRANVREQQAVMQSQPALTFEELRARLPQEVSDGVVRLLASSEAALIDFANIDTEQDIALFNQKYNVDLQLPTQVA
tara:strand:+ start:488 stop:2101 length:1614 start_codon:yes stop_codon:yes gene_type:complete